jgi:hypothetical protein
MCACSRVGRQLEVQMPEAIQTRIVEPGLQAGILRSTEKIAVIGDRRAQPIEIGVRMGNGNTEVVLHRIV